MQSIQDKSHYSGLQELIEIENNLLGYNNFIAGLFEKALKNKKVIVDFGAGIGTLSEIYKSISGISPLCVEIDDKARCCILKKGFNAIARLEDIESEVDGVFCSNVLEHISDDREILEKLNSKMKVGAKLLVYVPAFMMLFSDLDRKVGHYRRYGKKEMVSKLNESGFRIERIHYVDSIGFIASLFLRLKSKKRGMKDSEAIMPVSSNSMKFYDRIVFPISRLFDFIGIRFLFGKNIFVIAEKC